MVPEYNNLMEQTKKKVDKIFQYKEMRNKRKKQQE